MLLTWPGKVSTGIPYTRIPPRLTNFRTSIDCSVMSIRYHARRAIFPARSPWIPPARRDRLRADGIPLPPAPHGIPRARARLRGGGIVGVAEGLDEARDRRSEPPAPPVYEPDRPREAGERERHRGECAHPGFHDHGGPRQNAD